MRNKVVNAKNVKTFKIEEMEADHEVWSKGGKTTDDNCQMLCIKDHKLMKNK